MRMHKRCQFGIIWDSRGPEVGDKGRHHTNNALVEHNLDCLGKTIYKNVMSFKKSCIQSLQRQRTIDSVLMVTDEWKYQLSTKEGSVGQILTRIVRIR